MSLYLCSMSSEPSRFTNEHLANERTFLAWVRTAIAIMAFGFVVVKFSIFVRQFSKVMTDKAIVLPGKGYSPYIGVFLFALGGILLLLSFWQFKRVQVQIEKNIYQTSSFLTVVLTSVIFLGSIALIVYLYQSI